jgi:phytol kinase
MGEAIQLEHFAQFVPEPAVALVVAPIALVYSLAVAAFASHLRTRRGVRAPFTRKLFHFGIFTMAAVVQWASGPAATVVFGSVVALVVLYIVYRGDGFGFYEALARPTDAPHRSLFILVPLATTAAGGVISNLLFLRYAFVGYLVCGWGDAIGEPVGTRWGRHRYRVASLAGVVATRSLEGSASVLAVGTLAAFVGLLAGGFAPAHAIGIAAAAGTAGAVVEAFSTHGLDNLTVQIAAAGVAYAIGA